MSATDRRATPSRRSRRPAHYHIADVAGIVPESTCATRHYSPGFLLSHDRSSHGRNPHPGITIDADGNYFIDKCHRGTRICLRLGPTTIEQAGMRLKREVAHAHMQLARRAHARPLFRDCAASYLAQRHERRSLATMQIHVRLLLTHIGDLGSHLSMIRTL